MNSNLTLIIRVCFLVLCGCLISMTVNAQVAKGDVFLGGTVELTTTSTGQNHSTGFGFAPAIGKFVNDKNAFGVGLGIYSDKTGTSFVHQTSVAVFHRLYLPITPSFYFVLHSQASVGFAKQGDTANPPYQKSTLVELSTGPRFTYFASKHWAFELAVGGVGFTSQTSKTDISGAPSTTTTTFNLYGGASNVGLAVFYYINK